MDDTGVLTRDVLRLAEGIHNFSLATILQSVVIVLLFVFVLYFLYDIRARSKQLESQTKDLTVLTGFAKSIAEYMKESAVRQVNIDQARVLVRSELDKSKNAILFFIGKTMQRNNLADKKAVEDKVETFINTTYGDNESVLVKFDFQQRPLSSFLETAWREEVKSKIIEEFDRFEQEQEEGIGMDCVKIEEKYTAIFNKFKMAINHKIDKIT